MDNKENLGIKLKQLREEKQLTQQNIADLLQTSKQVISSYEKGKREPSIDIIIFLANYYNASTDYLLGISDCRARTNKEGNIFNLDNIRLAILYKLLDSEDFKNILTCLEFFNFAGIFDTQVRQITSFTVNQLDFVKELNEYKNKFEKFTSLKNEEYKKALSKEE